MDRSGGAAVPGPAARFPAGGEVKLLVRPAGDAADHLLHGSGEAGETHRGLVGAVAVGAKNATAGLDGPAGCS